MKFPKIPGFLPSDERLTINWIVANVAVFTHGDELQPGTIDRLEALRKKGAEIILFSTHPQHKASEALEIANFKLKVISLEDNPRRAKLKMLKPVEPKHCAVIANCLSDELMLGYEGNAILRFAVLCQFGLSPRAMKDAHIIFQNGCDALDALLHPKRLIELLGV